MIIKDIITEGKNRPCIVVDVQPAYRKFIKSGEEMMKFLNQQNKILIYANTADDGAFITDDSIYDIREYWEELGFNPDKWNDIEIINKGYGYLRNWMDEGVNDDIIIKVIRLMYQQGVG